MCLSCVGRLVEADTVAGTGIVDTDGGPKAVSLVVLDVEGRLPAVGDWVLVHTGFAVEVLDAEVALAEQEFGRRVRAAGEEAASER